jgi:hypothetical protein
MKEYLYNFVDGGWNFEMAPNKRTAIKQAKARWGERCDDRLIVDVKSFRVSTKRDYDNLIGLFN